DPSFGTDGKVTTRIGTAASADALVLQEDGKIVVAGLSSDSRNRSFAVVRYNPDGSLDTSFGTGGQVTTAINAGSDEAHPFAPQYIYGRVYGGIALQTD